MKESLEKLIDKSGLTEQEIKTLLKQYKTPKLSTHNTHSHFYNEKHCKLGIISDLHIGSNKFREDIFLDSVKKFNEESVDAIYCPGDIIEGMSNREGHCYELSILGTSKQVDYAIELLKQYRQPFNFILGNHDLWGMVKSNQGVNIGTDIESRVPNSKYLGDMKADIKLSQTIDLQLTHEGNSAYALSYSLQKRINSLEGGTKPDIMCNGHLHKALYMFYRNIHALECATMQSQTDFMAMKGSPAHLGFYILDIKYNKTGITEFTPIFRPYY